MSPSSVDSCDAAIVLGARVLPDGSPSPALARRVGHGVALALSGRADFLIMSGGLTRPPRPEAQVMRDLAIKAGVAPERIVTEERSLNTIGNAIHSKPLVDARGWRRLSLVTDACHTPRAMYVFHRCGLPARAEPVWPDGPPAWEWWAAWAREAAALPWTALRVEWMRLKERAR